MKTLGLVLILFSTQLFASEQLTCELQKKVLKQSQCVECLKYNNDNDCIQERTISCLESQMLPVGIKKSVIITSEDIYLGFKNEDYRFAISQGKSGYTAILESTKELLSAELNSVQKIDQFTLRAKNARAKKADELVEVLLNCSVE
ncbi:MAG: hypothetical protein AB7I27_03135 [Bacteriovoracaceae bacterium]